MSDLKNLKDSCMRSDLVESARVLEQVNELEAKLKIAIEVIELVDRDSFQPVPEMGFYIGPETYERVRKALTAIRGE